jgi:serine/threonine-protein kinase
VYGRPQLLWVWIRKARRTQIALVIALPVLIFLAPPAIEAVLERVEPVGQSWAHKVIGAVTGESSRRAERQSDWLRGAWLITFGGLAILFCSELPSVALKSEPMRSSGGRIRRGTPVGGRYRLLEQLGSGASGTVYVAEDTILERRVALKEMHFGDSTDIEESSIIVARFRDEARALARLSHPHIVQVFDLVDEGDRCWIAMELVEGGDLSSLLRREGPLPWRRAFEVVVALAEALDCLHAMGIVHRDVKPSNVLLTPAGTPKLADFGLAKSPRSCVETHSDLILGSPAYMSPEQIESGIAGPRSDVYGLGVVLYELLTGRPPFQGEAASVLVQHAIAEPTPPSHVSPASEIPQQLDALVLSMLDKEPEGRPSGQDELVKRMRGVS